MNWLLIMWTGEGEPDAESVEGWTGYEAHETRAEADDALHALRINSPEHRFDMLSWVEAEECGLVS